MDFRYRIGNMVISKGVLETVLAEIQHSDNFVRLDRMRILERRSVECVGGTQLFYSCEAWDGTHRLFAEDSLMPSDEAGPQWVTELQKQLARHTVPPGGGPIQKEQS